MRGVALRETEHSSPPSSQELNISAGAFYTRKVARVRADVLTRRLPPRNATLVIVRRISPRGCSPPCWRCAKHLHPTTVELLLRVLVEALTHYAQLVQQSR